MGFYIIFLEVGFMLTFYGLEDAFIIISVAIAMICAILCFVFVIPEKRRAQLNGFMRYLADIFNFKSLLLEKILKFVYIFSTVYIILLGFFILISAEGENFIGLLIMILAPIVLRLAYEPLMMFIVLVKNSSDINNKLPHTNKKAPTAPVAPVSPVSNENVSCPVCGEKTKNSDSAFCTNCGHKF